ncbi:MAG: WD repeat-containing protein slp1 [Marteilia pararefringens]
MKAMNIHNNNNKRTIEEKSLGTFDASQIPADFYLTPIDLHETRDELILIWSNSIIQYKNRNVLDTILEIDNGEQQRLFSIKYIPNNLFCTVGCQNGKGILLDLEKKKAIRFFGCITEDQSERRINCMDIKNSTIASGYNNGTLCFSDIREKPNTFQINENYHSDSQVCSLKWNMSNSILLASGASDSVVIISDQRKADEKIFSTRNKSIYTEKRVELINHRSSVKGLAWSPKGSSIIATGGGINDNMLHLWDIERNTNSPIISIDTKAQISSIFWPITMPNTIFTFHGASESFKGFIRIWNISHDFDSIETRSDIQAHGSRITSAVASLKTNQCVTLSSDRTLKFWQFLPSNLQTAASNDLQYSKLETLK